MTAYQEFKSKHAAISKELRSIELPQGKFTLCCDTIGSSLGVTGATVRNHLAGVYKDGYLAEAIVKECKRLKILK